MGSGKAKLRSKSHLQLQGQTRYAICYRNGARFCENACQTEPERPKDEIEQLVDEGEASNPIGSEPAPPGIKAVLNEAARGYRR